MTFFNSSTIPVLEQVVQFTEARHGVLAGNIANLDTPGYKTRDLSPELFSQKLREAIHAKNTTKSSTPSAYGYSSFGIPEVPGPPGGLGIVQNQSASSKNAVKQKNNPFSDVKEAFRSVLRHDGADVSLEHQVTEIAKNQAQHNLALSLMVSQFRLLEAAISERA